MEFVVLIPYVFQVYIYKWILHKYWDLLRYSPIMTLGEKVIKVKWDFLFPHNQQIYTYLIIFGNRFSTLHVIVLYWRQSFKMSLDMESLVFLYRIQTICLYPVSIIDSLSYFIFEEQYICLFGRSRLLIMCSVGDGLVESYSFSCIKTIILQIFPAP